jgi:hypothetical protein
MVRHYRKPGLGLDLRLSKRYRATMKRPLRVAPSVVTRRA